MGDELVETGDGWRLERLAFFGSLRLQFRSGNPDRATMQLLNSLCRRDTTRAYTWITSAGNLERVLEIARGAETWESVGENPYDPYENEPCPL